MTLLICRYALAFCLMLLSANILLAQTGSVGADSLISASSFLDLAFSCTCSEVGWDLCAGSVREPITAWVRDAAPVRPREPRRFQGLRRFSRIPNSYNRPGNLLPLNQQPRRRQQMEF